MRERFKAVSQAIDNIPDFAICGRVLAIRGLLVECTGLEHMLAIGARCRIITRNHKAITTEVVGFGEHSTYLMPFSELEGVGAGCAVEFVSARPLVYPHVSWIGRVINANAEPLDGKGPLMQGNLGYDLKNVPPPAHKRKRLKDKIDLGVKAVNCFTSCCYGQRMGIFSGSGVGKSVLISMIARYALADIKVIGLIGERGREVMEFIEGYLGEDGLKNTIVVVATGDEPALIRRQAAYMTMAIAEYFRDQEQNVLCIMDNITRFAMAQREIGLASGEPPSTKGYTPTVFSELPKLLERAGPGAGNSSITGLFAVLVEGDDTNEPVADTVRGILDGHIVLDRAIAERGRFPAIDVLRSISRTMPECNTIAESNLVSEARKLLATYNDLAEIIRIGAYKKGTDPEVDRAIYYYPRLEQFFSQLPNQSVDVASCFRQLAEVLDFKNWENEI